MKKEAKVVSTNTAEPIKMMAVKIFFFLLVIVSYCVWVYYI